VLFLPRSTSLARAPSHPAASTRVAARGRAAPAAKTHVAQAPNARSGAHPAVSKAPVRKGKTVVAHKGGAPARAVPAKTRVAQP